ALTRPRSMDWFGFRFSLMASCGVLMGIPFFKLEISILVNKRHRLLNSESFFFSTGLLNQSQINQAVLSYSDGGPIPLITLSIHHTDGEPYQL
ncbi:MAG: hypothetical protein KBH10_10125, partial [Laribacter sp.]|nr:hypothetical protein [Laribacter sp.]